MHICVQRAREPGLRGGATYLASLSVTMQIHTSDVHQGTGTEDSQTDKIHDAACVGEGMRKSTLHRRIFVAYVCTYRAARVVEVMATTVLFRIYLHCRYKQAKYPSAVCKCGFGTYFFAGAFTAGQHYTHSATQGVSTLYAL